jgi:hypothetical protein
LIRCFFCNEFIHWGHLGWRRGRKSFDGRTQRLFVHLARCLSFITGSCRICLVFVLLLVCIVDVLLRKCSDSSFLFEECLDYCLLLIRLFVLLFLGIFKCQGSIYDVLRIDCIHWNLLLMNCQQIILSSFLIIIVILNYLSFLACLFHFLR